MSSPEIREPYVPIQTIEFEVRPDAIQRARFQYFGNHDDAYYRDDPEVWPWRRVVVDSELEGAVVQAIAPDKMHLEIMSRDQYDQITDEALAA